MKPGLNSLHKRDACNILLQLEMHCSNNRFLLLILLPHLWNNNIGKCMPFFLSIPSKEARLLRSRPSLLFPSSHTPSPVKSSPVTSIPAKLPIQNCLFLFHTKPYVECRRDDILKPIRIYFKYGRSASKIPEQYLLPHQQFTNCLFPRLNQKINIFLRSP